MGVTNASVGGSRQFSLAAKRFSEVFMSNPRRPLTIAFPVQR
jgi:hypothetical protein